MSEAAMVRSADGTLLSVKRLGQGPPLVLVHGTALDRRCWSALVPGLAGQFTLHLLDRRGRRGSASRDDTTGGDYDIRREGEDVAAVVEAAGRDVHLVGHSYGALCSLEAALITDAIGRMILYEPPAPTPGHPVIPPDVLDRLHTLAAAGEAEAMLETFARQILAPADFAAIKTPPIWQASLDNASTIMREARCVTAFDTSDRLSGIAVPVRFLLGTESPAYHRPAIEAIAAGLHQTELTLLHGQAHLAISHDPRQVAAAILAPPATSQP
ncbi:alpha/beta fold hydrolase [Actinomadura sp. 9N215]|uniref:alpha/beta fold hydrolase n=1 Tax=Actinomadura sp. 9N215 TaxID=3375150 RepID=UPI0037BDABBB